MKMVALRIPDNLKKEMERIKMNWSDYIRDSIRAAVDSEKKRLLFARLHQIYKGRKRAKPGTAAGIIREIRDHG